MSLMRWERRSFLTLLFCGDDDYDKIPVINRIVLIFRSN